MNDPSRIVKEAMRVLKGEARKTVCPELWDGKTAERIVQILVDHMT